MRVVAMEDLLVQERTQTLEQQILVEVEVEENLVEVVDLVDLALSF
jgi:hypothetical protein